MEFKTAVDNYLKSNELNHKEMSFAEQINSLQVYCDNKVAEKKEELNKRYHSYQMYFKRIRDAFNMYAYIILEYQKKNDPTSFFMQYVKENTMCQIRELNTVYVSPEHIRGFVISILQMILKLSNANRNIDEKQLFYIADVVIVKETWNCLTINEFVTVLKNGIHGEYGNNYQTIDIGTLENWLKQYNGTIAKDNETSYYATKPIESKGERTKSEEEMMQERVKLFEKEIKEKNRIYKDNTAQ